MVHGDNNNRAEWVACTSTSPDLYRHLLAEETTTSLPLKENSSLTHEPTKVGESCEARRRFSTAKSISSTKFFGDHKKSTLEMVMNDVSSLVGKTKKSLETLSCFITSGLDGLIFPKLPGDPRDIEAIRRDVTDLMQKLHGEEAKAIPWDTRMKWVDEVCERVVTVTYGVSTNGHSGGIIFKLRNDAWDLLDLILNENVEMTKIA